MKQALLFLIKLYRRASIFHPLFQTVFLTGSICRFSPTCSEYMEEAIIKRGAINGLFLGIKRILRCHPWSKGGYDPLPETD